MALYLNRLSQGRPYGNEHSLAWNDSRAAGGLLNQAVPHEAIVCLDACDLKYNAC